MSKINSSTPTILKKIISRKVDEIKLAKAKINLDTIKSLAINSEPTRGFVNSIKNTLTNNRPSVIAEIKKASPSKGILRTNFNSSEIAKSYFQAGASCLSVLTDVDFFQGHSDYLQQARNSCPLPILRKDFMIDEYQIYESKAMNADCILLIAAVLNTNQMQDLSSLAQDLNMDVLVEVHNQSELESALTLNLSMLGINNRDLHTFDTNIQTSIDLSKKLDENIIVVSESGISNPADIKLMQSNNINTFLVGEAFMKAENPGAELKNMFNL